MISFGFEETPDVCGAGRKITFVSEDELYTPKKGYGFVTRENYKEQPDLQVPAVSSGFIPKDYIDKRPTPVMFRVNVGRQGNFRVKASFENDGTLSEIFLERRRLYYVGEFVGSKEFTWYVNVCDVIPEHTERVYSDNDLDISWVGDGIKVKRISVEPVNCPTLFIAGDSTVTDQPADYPYSPGTSYSGWGQMITAYLQGEVAVSNHAHSGLTTESFRKEGHYSIISKYIKRGDYFFMQFGHNDQKLEHLRENIGYRENILRYIEEVRAVGAIPVIVTPLSRNTWKNEGKEYNDLLEKYAVECILIGKETGTCVLDLHKLSMDEYKENGLEESKKYFFPGDLTHTNDFGAYFMAGLVASEISKKCSESKDNSYNRLCGYLIPDVYDWKIDKEKLILPKLKEDEENKADEPYALKMDRLEEIIRRK